MANVNMLVVLCYYFLPCKDLNPRPLTSFNPLAQPSKLPIPLRKKRIVASLGFGSSEVYE